MNRENAGRLTVWAPLSPLVYLRRPVGHLPYPLQEASSRLYARARHGLYSGVRALGLLPGDKVLVPAYNNGSEVEALCRAELECVFYEVDRDLMPDGGALDRLLDDDVRALYVIHYFGIPRAGGAWRRWCDERNLLLIEDAAMAWLATDDDGPVGSTGDLAIYCLYKTVGLPDGGCTVSRAPAEVPNGPTELGFRQLAIRHASWIAQRNRLASGWHRSASRRLPGVSRLAPAPEGEFSLGDPSSRPSATTRRLVSRAVAGSIASRRRENFRYLVSALADDVDAIIPVVPDGASPVGFPIWIPPEQGDKLLVDLEEGGVFASRFWTTAHPSLAPGAFPAADRLRSHCIVLPCHQELMESDLRSIVTAVRASTRRR